MDHKMTNQRQDITEKHWQRQLPLLNCKQTLLEICQKYSMILEEEKI